MQNILKNGILNGQTNYVNNLKNVELIEKLINYIMQIKPNIIHVKAHTCLDDEHSLGNALADQFANAKH